MVSRPADGNSQSGRFEKCIHHVFKPSTIMLLSLGPPPLLPAAPALPVAGLRPPRPAKRHRKTATANYRSDMRRSLRNNLNQLNNVMAVLWAAEQSIQVDLTLLSRYFRTRAMSEQYGERRKKTVRRIVSRVMAGRRRKDGGRKRTHSV